MYVRYWKGRMCFWFLTQKRARLAHYSIDKASYISKFHPASAVSTFISKAFIARTEPFLCILMI